ncbi:MAG: hypothetical protein N2748_01170 [candidate division WOR-3 bacterium]|nr:hypothetical protein [candidate division WOR-3 bacterium]
MPKLRITEQKWLFVDQDKLNPNIGCGLCLKKTPKFHLSDALMGVFQNYGIKQIFADKSAQQILENSNTIKQFYTNANAKMLLSDNFRITFAQFAIYLIIDKAKQSAWFLADAENRLIFNNYYKEIFMTNCSKLGITIVGSQARLNEIGWQNLYDVFDEEFIRSLPPIKTIEIMTNIPDVRWRNPNLSLSISLLHLTEPEDIRQAINKAITGKES